MKEMKKLFNLTALFAAVLLVGCSSEDELSGVNEERGVVKTEFTISFPAKAVGNTRMTTAIVQGQSTPVFRGISGIELYPFSDKVTNITANPSGFVIPTPITLKGSTTNAITALNPTSSDDANFIAGSSNLFADNNGHLYQDVEVAVGTKAFMFYGVAPLSSGGDMFTDGSLTKAVGTGGKLSDITFNLVPIYDNLGNNYDDIENYLTTIANTTGWSNTNNVILSTLYDRFTSMKAGSWASVKGAVQQLYETLHGKTFSDTADNTLKSAILTNIKSDANVDDSNDDGTLEFTPNAYDDFPAEKGLPDGAIYMNWDWVDSSDQTLGKKFKMITTPATNNNGLDITDLTKFVYPASLYYHVLSNIRTSTESKLKYYDAGTDHQTSWSNVVSQYGDEVQSGDNQNDMVKTNTRSIAIVDQVQYAVGRLDVTVSTSHTSLTDGAGATIQLTHLSDPNDNTSTVNNFPVTGLLIGNQRAVDYRFNPVTVANPTLYTIYDKTIEGDKYLKNAGINQLTDADKIHTLVLETPTTNSTEDDNAMVKIAVEFLNNSGSLFVGQGGNIIYPNTKFYLVGTFDPKNASNTTANPNSLNQVFKQDYTTTANLVIGSLRNAYNTLPDLRSPQLELGLSVDLSWQTGITQTIEIQ